MSIYWEEHVEMRTPEEMADYYNYCEDIAVERKREENEQEERVDK